MPEPRKPGPFGLDGGACYLPEKRFVRELVKKWQCDDDVRSEIARVARSYVGSLRWREDIDHVVKCSKFVDHVLTEVFSGALGHHLEPPPRIGGWRSFLAHALEVHTESPRVHDLGVRVRAGRNIPPLAGDWAIRWIEIPMWRVVADGSVAAQPGDIVSEWIFYRGASGHVGIVIGTGQTVSVDSTASPAGKITISDYGFRAADSTVHNGHGKAMNCTIRRFSCPEPPLWHS